MALPTFVIIGAMKAGTTSLHHYLGQHPQIQMASIKETNFFSGPPDGIPYPAGLKRIEHLKDYEQLFDPAFAVRGEASPGYTVYPQREGVPERIKDLVPKAKLIYLVRDPIARAVSQYQHHVSYENERRSLEDALDPSDPYGRYTSPSFYAAQLDRYLQHFPLESILVVNQADLLADRQTTLREIFAFLAVDDSFYSRQFDKEMNTGKELRTYSNFVVLVRYARATPLQRLPRGLRVFLRRTVRRIVSRPLERHDLNDDLRRRLQELYADDARRLRELTGKAFSTWSV
jgi:Sulfotransferase domain.